MRAIMFTKWAEMLRKHATGWGRVISLHDGIMGSFYYPFILSHNGHLLLWWSENKTMIKQPTFLLAADVGPYFLMMPFSLALTTFSPPWLIPWGSGGPGWDSSSSPMPRPIAVSPGAWRFVGIYELCASVQVPGCRFIELHKLKKESRLGPLHLLIDPTFRQERVVAG